MISEKPSRVVVILILFVVLAFAFVTNEAVHELRHYMMHRIYGAQVRIGLDPFGSSRILGGASSTAPMGPTSLADPLFSLPIGGIALVPLLLPLTGLSREGGFGRRWLVVILGMGTFMLLRLAVSVLLRSGDLMEGVAPLVFALLLSLGAAAAFPPMQRWLGDRLGIFS